MCVGCDKFGGYRPRTQENVRPHARFDHYGGDEEADMEAFKADCEIPPMSPDLISSLGLLMAEYALNAKLSKVVKRRDRLYLELGSSDRSEYDRIKRVVEAL